MIDRVRTKAKTKRVSSSLDKRRAIVEAARELFTTQGYEATTIAEVARQSRVAVGTVYLYFSNKNDLLYAVKSDWEREFLQFLLQPELQAIPHHKRALPLMRACFEMCQRNTQMIQMMGLQAQHVGEWHTQDSGPIVQGIQAFLDDAVAAGAFRPNIDTKVAAITSFGMVESALEQCFLVEGGKDQERYIRALADALEHWFVRPELLQDQNV
jgi:TetR/AcrR family transcriptional regulator, fatty acid metabolism regulator protein